MGGTITAEQIRTAIGTVVTGSAQISLTATTGYGTYINQAVLTTSSPTFSNVKGSSYFDAQASSGFRIRNSNDTANAGGFTRRGLWEGNANYDPGMWAETGYGLYFYTNGSATPKLVAESAGTIRPGVNGTQDLGSSSYRWSTVYTSDLSLNNGIGDWTIVEGEDDLFLYNNKKGKVYKFALTEVDPNVATPKKS